MIVAIAGKGGTGKTTFASLLIRSLKERQAGSVLAIDADPNANLGEMLGVKNTSTIVGIIDDISKNPGQIPASITKERFIDLKIQESLEEEDGFDLLTMGRPEGPGCYCFINNLLRELIRKLMNSYSYIVVDNEAGMEHLSRRLMREMDTLFVISDSSVIGLRSAARILELAGELEIKIKDKFLILNKAKGENKSLEDEMKKTGLDLKSVLPLNTEIEKFSIENKSIFELDKNNPLVAKIKIITP